MTSWLQSIWDYITGGLSDVRNWILSIISAVYSYTGRMFTVIEDSLRGVYNAALDMYHSMLHFASSIADYARWIVTSVIPSVARWASRQIDNVFSFARSVASFATREISRLGHYIDSIIKSIVSWILHNIWNPLYDGITGLFKWVRHEGTFMLDLLTHPAKLAKVLGQYLETAWIDIMRRNARVIGRFLTRQMMSHTGEIADLLERIIAAML